MLGGPSMFASLARMLRRVVGLRLREIILRVRHELGHGLFAAEAIGLAIKLSIDGAVGLYVFAHGKGHCALVAKLAVQGQRWRGETKQENARSSGLDIRSNHRSSPWGWGLPPSNSTPWGSAFMCDISCIG